LLASLLGAAGIKAYPALINSSHELDLDVPSPAQFDHVITAVPQGNGSVWLDTTAEVAPFGYLLALLRDKQALVIPVDKSAAFLTTPAEPPTKAAETFHIDAKLKDDGTLEGKIERNVSGDDAEVLLRAAFRRVPMPQWKDLVQQISYNSGFAGEVSDVTASPPEKFDSPFTLSYSYTRKDFPQWSERRISSPLPPVLGPLPDTKATHPILLGPIAEFRNESRVDLPDGYSPHLPTQVDLKEDFAEYHASYSFARGALQTVRTLVVKQHEVPLDKYETYKRFAMAVADDYARTVVLFSTSSSPNSLQKEVANLPYSDNSEAMQAFNDAVNQARSGNIPAVIDSLNRAVKADPHFARAWLLLAGIYVTTSRHEMALETFRRAREADPDDSVVNRAFVSALMDQQEYQEAASVLQNLVKSEPGNSDMFSALGGALSLLKRYDEAAGAVESAIKLAPDHARLYSQLGSIYMHGGKQDQALEAFAKAIDLDSSPEMLNSVSYEMADAGQSLPLSLEYAKKAVRAEEESTAQMKLADLSEKDLASPSVLSAYWDTLGWAYFKLGELDEAAKYLSAAWTISQNYINADHLGQVYEQEHKKDEAARMYRLALIASPKLDATKETQERLDRLGASANPGRFGNAGREELSKLRTVKLPSITSESASAEFFLLFGPGSKLQEIQFVSGSEKLRSADRALSAASFEVPFPDNGPTRLLRRGVLSCSSISGCTFVLYTPDMVRSRN